MKTATKSPALVAALDAANKAAAVTRVMRTTGMAMADVTSPDGKQLDTLQFLASMRKRGYQVSEPRIPKTQTRPGFTAWKVNITLPTGVALQLVFFTPGVTQ